MLALECSSGWPARGAPDRVVCAGAPAAEDEHDLEAERVLKILLTECSVKQAANLAAQITGRKKNALYDRALQLKGEE